MSQIITDTALVATWLEKRLTARFNADAAIGLDRGNGIVAGVVYEGWNGASFVVHIAVRGLLTPTYLAAIFHYPFVHCEAQVLIAPVAPTNAESINFVKKLGFQEQAELPRAHPDGSLLLFMMQREQCRFIGARYARFIKAA